MKIEILSRITLKSTKFMRLMVFVIGVITFALAPRASLAQGPVGGYPYCFLIDSYPYTIVAPGVYCVAHKVVEHVYLQPALITIKSDNVVLDLNGSTLIGDSARVKGSSYGVYSVDQKNVTVRNGTLRGFDIGINLTHFHGGLTEDSQTSHGLIAEELKVYRNKITAIRAEGNGTTIRDNQVMGTGGFPDTGGFTSAYGILSSGKDVRIINNDVMDTRANDSTGKSYAIYLLHTTITKGLVAVNNRITRADFGIFMPGGVGVDWGKYRDNVTIDVGTSYTGGTDIGNNN